MTKYTCEHSGIEFQTKDGWINVKNRLPEDDREVLCFEDGIIFVGECFSKLLDDGFEANDDPYWNQNSVGRRNPSHWMELPEPPNED